jgi:Flp pilus assembly protein TadG
MVEFALVLPILLLLLVGIVEFGRVYNAQVSIQGAAREGARALALGESAAAVSAAVTNAAPSVSSLTVSQAGCPAGSTSTSTAYATVTVRTNFTFGLPFIDLGTKTLTATARMRCGL